VSSAVTLQSRKADSRGIHSAACRRDTGCRGSHGPGTQPSTTTQTVSGIYTLGMLTPPHRQMHLIVTHHIAGLTLFLAAMQMQAIAVLL